jgi:hypothetical protein
MTALAAKAMDLDHLFRMVLIAGVWLVLPVGICQRLRSQASCEPLDRRKEGVFVL